MILTITNTQKPSGDLGFLLHKHPDKFQSIDLSVGKAHIFYPESTEEKTTVALLLDIDPIDMVRGGGLKLSGKGFSLGQYVNDRPYVASSFMSVALSKAFSTAMNGKCSTRPELVDKKLPLTATISVLPAPRGGEPLIRKMFESLGYQVNLERHILDEQFDSWGDSKHFTLELSQTTTLKELLSHLYVLIPAIDNDKHYFVSQNEIDKLLDKGKGWLNEHPERDQIISRYMINLRSLTRQTLARLAEGDEVNEGDEELPIKVKERKENLHQQRLNLAAQKLVESGARSVIDLGCGEGKLIRLLMKERQFDKIAGVDISYSELLKAKDRLHWDEIAPRKKERVDLFQGALTYKDDRLAGYDAAALVEVIEHLDEDRLQSFERVVFECAKPKTVVLTTPNSEYNSQFESMEAGSMRHTDHRFEWTREQFETWANGVAERNSYKVEFTPIGEEVELVGAPSQMGVFTYGD